MAGKKKQNKKSNTSGKPKPVNNAPRDKVVVDTNPNPFVSVCTPTFNRRPFIPSMIQMYKNQDYPKDRMEWIIIDDGSDPIEDLITEAQKEIPNIKYYKFDTKMHLGKKRNIMHEKSIGNILVYMDDDDYYPHDRVSHAVQKLKDNKQAMCAGSSEIYVYFKHIEKIIQFGPYSANHATAGTFAFRRELLENGNTYEDEAALAEEKKFLKDYTVPFVQLDPTKTILVFSHEHNTFDKRKLLENPNPKVVRDAKWTVKDLVREGELRDFFVHRIHKLLKSYEPGLPKHKPDVLKQTEEIRLAREKMIKEEQEKMAKMGGGVGNIVMRGPDGKDQVLTNDQIVHLLQKRDEQVRMLQVNVNQLEYKLKQLDKTGGGDGGDDDVMAGLMRQKISLLEKQNEELKKSNGNNGNGISSDDNDAMEGLMRQKISLLEKQNEELKIKLESSSDTKNEIVSSRNEEDKNTQSLMEKKIELLEFQVQKLKEMKKNEVAINVNVPGKGLTSYTMEQVIDLLKEKDHFINTMQHKVLETRDASLEMNQQNELLKEKISVLEFVKTKQDDEIARLKKTNIESTTEMK